MEPHEVEPTAVPNKRRFFGSPTRERHILGCGVLSVLAKRSYRELNRCDVRTFVVTALEEGQSLQCRQSTAAMALKSSQGSNFL